MLYVLPGALYLSYHPVMTMGASESMNLELSVPLVMLVILDVVLVFGMIRKRKWGEIKWWYLLLPVFASLSIIWSENVLRGMLTAGILWAIMVAVVGVVILRDEIVDEKYRERWLVVFLVETLVVSVWCMMQCVMDVAGVGREVTLLCEGCTYRSFGFPHPNGWAVEPQFMGNLLIAPVMVCMWEMLRGKRKLIWMAIALFVTAFVLFLTFSRGAIYATAVGVIFVGVAAVVGNRKRNRRQAVQRVVAALGVIVVAFLMGLMSQGLMAEVGPTNENFGSAVAKAMNHLTLGVVDFRNKTATNGEGMMEASEGVAAGVNEGAAEVSEREAGGEETIFDGYVVESTEIRKAMTQNALSLWRSSAKNALVGVGLGGAGEAMYAAGLTDSPKEIVQNQYASVLAELGVVGVLLAVMLIAVVVRLLLKWGGDAKWLTLGMMAAYGVSLVFFAGLPNALQVYLMPAMVWVVFYKEKRKKLVS